MVQGSSADWEKTILLFGGSAMDASKPFIQNFGICHFYEKGRQEGTGNIQTSILPWQNCTMGGFTGDWTAVISVFHWWYIQCNTKQGYSCSIQEVTVGGWYRAGRNDLLLENRLQEILPFHWPWNTKTEVQTEVQRPWTAWTDWWSNWFNQHLSGNGWKHWILSVLW